MTEEYYIGQIFEGEYPPEAAEWCNENNAYVNEIEVIEEKGVENNGTIRQFKIFALPEETAEERKERFLQSFFKVGDYGYFRRIPKGYQSAVESMNVLFNVANVTKGIQEGLIIFYQEPDFEIAEQCTEEWLIEHQAVMPAMTLDEFMQLYVAFMTAWNTEEHE